METARTVGCIDSTDGNFCFNLLVEEENIWSQHELEMF